MNRIILLFALASAAGCRGDAPQLGTTAQPLFAANPTAWDFASVNVGSSAAPRGVTLSATGLQSQYYSVTAITESCPDFGLDLSTISLPAPVWRECDTCPNCVPDVAAAVCEAESQTFAVTFTPTVAGPQSCAITITYDGITKVITMSGTGVAPEYDLTVLSPAGGTLGFGDVVVSTTSSQLAIQLRSDGTMPLEITSAGFDGTGDPSHFTVTGGGPVTIQPGATHTIGLTCTPTEPGTTSAGFGITSNDPNQPLVTIQVTCTGIQSDLAIDPSPAQFPDTFVGGTSTVDVTLVNTGTADMAVESITVSPGSFTVTDPGQMMIPVMGSAFASVQFTADESVVDQDVQGELVVTFDGGQTRRIDLIGPARSAILSVTPASEFDFGTVCSGQARAQVFAALNLGSGEFYLTEATLAGDGFAITNAPGFPAPLPARGGATAPIEVTASPLVGEVTGTLTLVPAVASLAPATVNLRARGQDGGVGANPAMVAFEPVLLREASDGRAVTVTNCDAAPLAITSARVTGANASEFTAVTTLALPGSIAAYGSATWFVEHRPASAGDKAATLEIVHDGGTTSIPLTGFGVDDSDEDARGSYYACRSSSPQTWALLLLVALLAAVLPRRPRRA